LKAVNLFHFYLSCLTESTEQAVKLAANVNLLLMEVILSGYLRGWSLW